MKKLLLLLLPLLLLSSCTSTGEYKKVTEGSNKDYSHTMVTDIVKKGKVSQRFELRHGDCTGEDCHRDRQRNEYGTFIKYPTNEYWFSWSFYLNDNFMIEKAGTSLVQTKLVSNSSRGSVLWMLQSKEDSEWIDIKNETHYQTNACSILKVDDAIGKWTDIMIRADYSTSIDNASPITKATGSYLDVYLNGTKTSCRYNYPMMKADELANHGMLDSTPHMAFKYGIYQGFISRWLDENKTREFKITADKKWAWSPDNTPFDEDWGIKTPTAIVYYDEIRHGLTRESVTIGDPVD